MELVDFTNCKVEPTYIYSGANGPKIGIEYNNEMYMLKFPSIGKTEELSYSNSCFSEYIACHIFESLGFNVQKTILGTYKNNRGEEKIVCACKDFRIEKFELNEFAKLKNSILLDSSNNGYGTDLNEVIQTIEEQNIVSVENLKNFFWNMFIADALLGNFDRHNGNWGFLVNRESKEVKIAPIFDCGSCLYPQLSDEQMENILKDRTEIEKRIYIFPNSALKLNDKKISYYDFINDMQNEECTKALLRVFPRIDLDKINTIINETPKISDVRKIFYKTMIKERYEKILKVAEQKAKNRKN